VTTLYSSFSYRFPVQGTRHAMRRQSCSAWGNNKRTNLRDVDTDNAQTSLYETWKPTKYNKINISWEASHSGLLGSDVVRSGTSLSSKFLEEHNVPSFGGNTTTVQYAHPRLC